MRHFAGQTAELVDVYRRLIVLIRQPNERREAADAKSTPSEGQMSDYKGTALMIDALPKAKALLADRGYDADWFRAALEQRGITPCIPSKTNHKVPIPHDTALYRQRHKVENMFGKLKDWRRIHTRYDRCAHTFMSAICIAATVIFWLPQ